MHSVRYAHSEGYTEICYAQDKGQQFITSGEDGEIRIWQGFDDVDNRSIQVGEKCCALAYGDGKIYVADDQNEVKRYDLESGELLGVVTSFNMQVTCMCLNKSSTQLACGSANFEVHLVDLSSLKSTKFSGHEAPILSLCFDPFQKYFISASCDSSARIWSVANLNTVKTLNSLHAKSNDFVDSESWCKIAWHKDGGLFAVPNKKDVDFYERESWILKFKINLKNENNPSEEFVASILSFSPDGKHILAVTSTQMVFVHSIINKSLVYKYSYNKKSRMCSLVWHDMNEVLFCDIKGQMGQIKPSLNGDKNNGESVAVVKETSAKKKGDDLEMDDLIGLLEDDDESSKQSSDSGVGKVKKTKAKSSTDKSMKSPKKKRMRTNDDGDEIEGTDESSRDSDDRVVAKSGKNKLSSDDEVEEVNELLDEAEEDDEMIGDDDEECDSMEKLKLRAYKLAKKEALLATAASELKETDQDNQLATKKPSTSYVESIQQKPFQPSSTPVSLNERYMVWNSVGVITQFNRDTDDSIDIEFHNASHHHTMHIKNQLGYTMADVSREAVVLASPGQQTDEASDDLNEVLAQAVTSTSKLTCIMLQSLDSAASREWQVDMPKREFIRCVSASRVLLACATSRKFLRVFYLSGVQRELICLNGLPVALAAYDHKIFVAYIANNRLEYSIYNLNPERKPTDETESGVLPISGGSDVQLAWLGFSEEGNPYCYDSSGYLYGRFSRALWSPISSLRATLSHKSDNYWLVGISERTQMVKAVLCRASKYPNVLPRPNISVIAMHMPLCDPDSEKTKLEQDYWKNALLANNIKSYEWQSNNVEDLEEDELAEKVESYEGAAREALMKLFMLACKAGKEQRAFDVATIMDVDAIQLAIKFATKSRALSLAHKLNDLAERKLRLEQQNKALESQYDTYYQGSSRMDSTHHHANHMNHNTTQDTSEIIIEGSTLPTQTNHTTASNKPSNDSINFESQITIDDSMTSMSKTPTIMPSTATRINPFASKSAMKNPLMMSNETQNDDNTTPKYSVLKDIEDKVNKRNAQSNAKDKDVWKPTPNRKLVKNKVSENNTPTIGSFFNK